MTPSELAERLKLDEARREIALAERLQAAAKQLSRTSGGIEATLRNHIEWLADAALRMAEALVPGITHPSAEADAEAIEEA